MKKYNIRLNFFWDDGDDMKEFVLIVPIDVMLSEVNQAIVDAHHFLCFEDEEDLYGSLGRTPETLIEFVCQKHRGWFWKEMEFEIDLNLA